MNKFDEMMKDAATFDSAWNALAESVKENGCLTLDIKEPFPFNRIQTFKINRANLDAIRAEMERAYKEELAAARAIEQAGQEAGK